MNRRNEKKRLKRLRKLQARKGAVIGRAREKIDWPRNNYNLSIYSPEDGEFRFDSERFPGILSHLARETGLEFCEAFGGLYCVFAEGSWRDKIVFAIHPDFDQNGYLDVWGGFSGPPLRGYSECINFFDSGSVIPKFISVSEIRDKDLRKFVSQFYDLMEEGK